jgi:hypothetical protein
MNLFTEFFGGQSVKYLIAPALLALAIAAPAQATEILTSTQSFTISPTAAPALQVINFDQFDSSLGTLQSVTLAFASTLITSGTLTNFTGASHTYTLTKNASASLNGNGFSFSQILTSGTKSLGTVAKGKTIDLAPISGAGDEEVTILTGFAPFIGNGLVSFNFASTKSFSVGPAAANLNLLASIGGAATLTYNYTSPVPEATSWALMLLGFGGVGTAMRRRTKVSFA